MTKDFNKLSVVVLLLIVFLTACKSTPTRVIRNYPVKSSSELVALIENSQLQFEHFSAKASVDVQTPDQSNSFRATLRIRRDSALWVSVSPAMGIEVFRLLCTQDSVLYIDKLKKEYFRGTYNKLNEIANSDLTFQALQDLLLGNPLYFEPEMDYRSRNDDAGYHLSTRNARFLRRVTTNDWQDDQFISLDTNSSDLKEKKLLRLQNKKDDDELVVRQYWLDYTHGKIVQSIFTDLSSALNLSAHYSGFEEVDGELIPSKISLALGNTKDQATFKLEYSRMKLNATFEMPFSIPEKYDEVRR